MSIFANLEEQPEIAEEADSLGAASGPLESGVYNCKITMAYIDKSKGGAENVNFTFETDTGREVRQTIYTSSGTAKGGKSTYIDKRTNKPANLPGFNLVNHIAKLAGGLAIGELATTTAEKKIIKVWDYEAKAEVPVEKMVILGLLDKQIKVGLLLQKENKNAKNDAGVYVPTAETREFNEVDKVFRASDNMTVAEILAKAEEATFMDSWAKKWTGQVKDKSKVIAGGTTAGLPGQTTAAKPTESLFGG